MSSTKKKVKVEISPEDRVVIYKRRRFSNKEDGLSEVSKNTKLLKKDPEKEENCNLDKHWQSWRKILNIQLNSLNEIGGIENCIAAALDTSPFTLIRKSQENGCINESILNKCINTCAGDNSTKCQNTLLDVLVSEKFAFLCHLLVLNFEEKYFMRFINLSFIHVRMKNGQYERSPDLFIQDIQQLWEKFEKIGHEIIQLTNNLSSIAKSSFQKQVGGEVEFGSEEKNEETCILNTETCICRLDSSTKININNNKNNNNNSEDSTTVQNLTQTLTLTQSDRSSHPETLIHPNPNFPTCKFCELYASNSYSLICDKCESTYHLSCIQPPLTQIPTQSWFCNSCKITEMPLVEKKSTKKQKPKSLHEDCVLCKELEKYVITEIPVEKERIGSNKFITEMPLEKEVIKSNEVITEITLEKEEIKSNKFITKKPLEKEEIKSNEIITEIAPQKLCKICKGEEDENKKFLTCGHNYCPYKYYHIRCLKDNQIAMKEQLNRPCWYCPSCLCRKCYLDKDDDNIVLCDSCDEAYHIYCMDPVRESVPSGNWFCLECNLERANRGMRIYEETVLKQHCLMN